MNKIIFALERKSRFLGEQRTELCVWHCSGVAQPKNGFGAKTLYGAKLGLGQKGGA